MSILSPQTVEIIEAKKRDGPSSQSTLLTALRLTQQERGRVGIEEIEYLADLLGLSPAVVEGVARFYDQITKERSGAHVVSLCRGIACYLHGAEELIQALGVAPGRPASDGRVAFRFVECIGDCDHAPAAMFDEEFLGPLSPEKLAARLQEAREKD